MEQLHSGIMGLAGDRAQVWMAFRSRDHRSYSSSRFIGEVITHKSPSYED